MICYLPVFAQDSMEIRYNVQLSKSFSVQEDYRNYNGILRVLNGKSFFFVEAVKKEVEKSMDMGLFMDTALIVKIDPSKNELYFLDFTMDNGLMWVKDSLYPMNWIIDTATKKVDELVCKKATCNFRGRNYVAWYAPDIPISMGPWKMGGLPGLIIELEDDKRIMVIKLGEIRHGTVPFKMPSAKVDRQEFLKMQKKGLENFVASVKASQKSDCLTCKTESTFSMGESLEKY